MSERNDRIVGSSDVGTVRLPKQSSSSWADHELDKEGKSQSTTKPNQNDWDKSTPLTNSNSNSNSKTKFPSTPPQFSVAGDVDKSNSNSNSSRPHFSPSQSPSSSRDPQPIESNSGSSSPSRRPFSSSGLFSRLPHPRFLDRNPQSTPAISSQSASLNPAPQSNNNNNTNTNATSSSIPAPGSVGSAAGRVRPSRFVLTDPEMEEVLLL